MPSSGASEDIYSVLTYNKQIFKKGKKKKKKKKRKPLLFLVTSWEECRPESPGLGTHSGVDEDALTPGCL
jgi:hypothetical protein